MNRSLTRPRHPSGGVLTCAVASAVTALAALTATPAHAATTLRSLADGTSTGIPSRLCLDVTGASTANGAPVQLWTCNSQNNQKWTLG